MTQTKNVHIRSLISGGLITNYHCSSKCKHCLYASSPHRSKDYIDKETAARIFSKVKTMNCHSLHIGGGEPFLNPEALKNILIVAQQENIDIEYVETNSSWYKNKNDHDSACQLLQNLKEAGLTRLLTSISPFHNEYIPFFKVKGVIAACKDVGISVFPWISDFYHEVNSFPDDQPHPLHDYIQTFGTGYLRSIYQRYWIHPGGRALSALSHVYGKKQTENLIEDNTPCVELTNTGHFHIDLYGNYIPGLCCGVQIDHHDMGKPLSENKYPFIHTLYNHGIQGLYRVATKQYGFIPQETYISKCHLCLDIRSFLILEKQIGLNEFGPKGFYEDLKLKN